MTPRGPRVRRSGKGALSPFCLAAGATLGPNDEIQRSHRIKDQLSKARSGRGVSVKALVRPVFLYWYNDGDRSSHFAMCTGLEFFALPVMK